MLRQSDRRDVIAEQRAPREDFRLQRACQGSRLTTDRRSFPDRTWRRVCTQSRTTVYRFLSLHVLAYYSGWILDAAPQRRAIDDASLRNS